MRLSPSCSPQRNARLSAAISNSGVAPTKMVDTGLIVTSPGLSSAHANFMVASVTPSSCLSYGVSFSKFARVTKSERDVEGGKHHYRYRALDQPVCGLDRRGGRTTLFVQREVPGIYGEGQDCCHKPITRLDEIDVTRWVS